MSGLEGVERTLRLTLFSRAAEQTRDDRLFDDPVALQWSKQLGPDEELDAWFRENPASTLSSNIRARVVDDIARTFLAEHPQGIILEIGAGLTTRPYRLGGDNWWLVDLPNVIATIQSIDPDQESSTLMAGDLRTSDWLARVPDARPRDILVIAEGVLFFLTDAEIRNLIASMHTKWPGFELVFDVMRPIHLEMLKQQFDQFAAFGAPVRSAYEPEDIGQLGLRALDVTYLLTMFPTRWDELGTVPASDRTPQNSSYVVHAIDGME